MIQRHQAIYYLTTCSSWGIRKEDIEIIALSLKKGIAKKVAEVVEVSEPEDIIPVVHTTGELGLAIKEQSLVLETKEGVVVLTGCAHPCLENILEVAKVVGELYGVVGGFHGFDKLELLKELKMMIPGHCTARKKEIRDRYHDEESAAEMTRIAEDIHLDGFQINTPLRPCPVKPLPQRELEIIAGYYGCILIVCGYYVEHFQGIERTKILCKIMGEQHHIRQKSTLSAVWISLSNMFHLKYHGLIAERLRKKKTSIINE